VAVTDDIPLRRLPTQARAEDKVRRMLDAADRLLATEGSAALGTKPLAEAAGVSVGTVYNWFADKDAIAEALALRHWGELAGLVAELAAECEAGTVDDPVGRTLDELAGGFRARPGFLALWFGELRTERLRDATRPFRTAVAESVLRMLTVAHPGSDASDRATVARMIVLLGDGILREAFRLDRAGDALVLAEGRIALRAYIEQRLSGGAA
jgi:AcrR family transcriptional regulator